MTYQETLYALLKETKKTTIFAMNSYDDAIIGIGFRRECCGSDLKDPYVDGIVFMLHATAWDNEALIRIETTKDLLETPNDNIDIILKADSSTYPSATVYLGRYRVLRMTVEASEDAFYTTGRETIPSRIRLDIERIS